MKTHLFRRCIACRHSKIKCTGDAPCANCQRRGLRCEFVEGVNRVVVSERSVRRKCCRNLSDDTSRTDIFNSWRKRSKNVDNLLVLGALQSHRSSRRLGPRTQAQRILLTYFLLQRKSRCNYKGTVMHRVSGLAPLPCLQRSSGTLSKTSGLGVCCPI